MTTARQDFTRENLPTSMKWPGRDNLGESSKAEFLASMQFARTNIYKDNFDVGRRPERPTQIAQHADRSDRSASQK